MINPKVKQRRRGTVIVDTNKGIILVGLKNQESLLLPGGGAEFYETRRQAAIRELSEETGLKASSVIYLFSYVGEPYQYKNNWVSNSHKVFLITAEGSPSPRNEIGHIKYYKPGEETKLSKSTNTILEKYLRDKQYFSS